jgi:CRP-like cAMP-binding protein
LAIENSTIYPEKFMSAARGEYVTAEKKFKKGDRIYSEGDTLTNLYVLQSGKVNLYLERGGTKSEIDSPIVGHVLGEQGIFGFPKQAFIAEAASEVKVVEIPIEPLKTVFEKSPAPYKLFVKALGDELRRLRGVVKTLKMEQDSSPCPQRFIPRLCAILTLVAKHIGQTPIRIFPHLSVRKKLKRIRNSKTQILS